MESDWEQRYVESNTPWDSGVPSEHLKDFLSDNGISPGRVLELGCGTGTNAIYLAQNGFDVTGVDLSKTAIERARQKSEAVGVNVRFIEADATNLGDIGQPFPFVFDRGTYHVIRKVNLAGFQKMLESAVAKGGYYLVLAGNANTLAPPEQGPPIVRGSEIVSEIEAANFDLIELRQTVFHGIRVNGMEIVPLAWCGLFQRREKDRAHV
ncbi:MAG: class I SAM-dependent methyltransferase [Candidatus Obscuribacterales bacterium]